MVRRKPAREREYEFAGYKFTSGPGGTRIHRGPAIDVHAPGDHGADPLGDGTFRMVPSGDIVSFDERNRRLEGRASRRQNAGHRRNGERKSCGFAIYTESEMMISENAQSFVEEHGLPPEYKKFLKADGTITKAGWDKLNNDTRTIEDNALAWLRKTFLNARDEGHGGAGDELLGTLFYDPDDKTQMELLELASPSPGRSERIDFQDTGFGNFRTAMDGVSSFGQTVLGGAIVFFDVDEEF